MHSIWAEREEMAIICFPQGDINPSIATPLRRLKHPRSIWSSFYESSQLNKIIIIDSFKIKARRLTVILIQCQFGSRRSERIGPQFPKGKSSEASIKFEIVIQAKSLKWTELPRSHGQQRGWSRSQDLYSPENRKSSRATTATNRSERLIATRLWGPLHSPPYFACQ